MNATETRWLVCNDCGGQSPVGAVHKCSDKGKFAAGQRMAADLVDSRICQFVERERKSLLLKSRHCGAGLLWLYRIAYRIRSRMNGLEKYKDRADMARVACELGGELYQ